MKKEKTKTKEKNTNDNKNDIVKNEEMPIIDEKIMEREMIKKHIPKEVSQEILKKIFKNLIIAIVVMIYFISVNILYAKLDVEKMEIITQAFSGVFILSGLIVLEIAYKKDSGTFTITAIELLVLSMHALFINHVITIYDFDFRMYLLTSSYIFAIYYVLKSIIIYTRAKMKYLKSLSDVQEIIKDEPIIKEAKKRKDKLSNTVEKAKVKDDLFERVEKMKIKQERKKNTDTKKKDVKKSNTTKKKEEVEQSEENQMKPKTKSKRGRKKKVETETKK